MLDPGLAALIGFFGAFITVWGLSPLARSRKERRRRRRTHG